MYYRSASGRVLRRLGVLFAYLALGAGLPAGASLVIQGTSPEPNQLGLGWNPVIVATFNHPLDPAHVTTQTIATRGLLTGPVEGRFRLSAGGRTVEFDPFEDPLDHFRAGELVEVTLTRALRSTTGEPLETPVSWHFRTFAQPGAGTFSYTQNIPCGYGVVAVEAGRLDDDDRLDLAAVRLGNEVQFYRNSTPPGVRPLTYDTRSYYIGSGYSSVLLRDLTGDGLMDVAVSDQDSNRVYVGRNLGNGLTFQWSSFETCDHPQRLASGDFNADGIEDLVYPCQYASQLQVRLGVGDGLFAPPATYAVGDWPIDVHVRDLDLDGDLDLVVSNELSEGISILRNQDPQAAPEEIFTVLPVVPVTLPKGILVQDLDGDRLPDIAVGTQDSARVVVFKMLPSCQLAPPRYYPTGGGPEERLRGVVGLDFDGDGDQDLAVTNSDADRWVLMENDGTGAFTVRRVETTLDRPIVPLAADLDGDGLVDVAVPARLDGRITLYLNDPNPAATGEPDPPPAIALSLSAAPNPSRGAVQFDLYTPGAGRLEIVDAAGRAVRALSLPESDRGTRRVVWDGLDAQGRPVSPGAYFVRLRGGEGAPARIVRIR